MKLRLRLNQTRQLMLSLQKSILDFSPGIFRCLIVPGERLRSLVVPSEVLDARSVTSAFAVETDFRIICSFLLIQVR